MKNKTTDEVKFLADARKRFENVESAESDNRENHIHDTKFENGEQWTDAEKKDRKDRPCLTDNRVAGAVKQILGDARMNRPRIKVRPVDSNGDPLIASIYTGLIRNIENVSEAETAYDCGHENAVRGNIGYWRIITEYSDDDTFDQDIFIKRIVNPHSVFLDQGSVEATYEDSKYGFIIEEMAKDDFKEEYPGKETTGIDAGGKGLEESGWFTDKTVRVAEYWWKEPCTKHLFLLADDKRVVEIENPVIETIADEGNQPISVVRDGKDGEPQHFLKQRKVKTHKVMQAVISGTQILEGPNEWPGKYIPIIPCLGEELWIEGKRILRSAIRHAIDPQKIHNWNVSNDMETKALAPKQPWMLTPEQLGDFKADWDQAYIRPMPYLLWNYVPGQPPPQRLTGSLPDAGAVQGIAMSIDAIKAATGIYDASLGNRTNESSGVAIERRQRQGSLATYVFTDNQVRAIKYTGKVLVDLIPKIYDGDRIVRLLGDDLAKDFAKQQQQMAPDGQPLINIDPNGREASARINVSNVYENKVLNDLSVGKYDIVVDAGPGYMTRRQEAADGMIQLSQAAPQFMPILVPRIAKNLDWPGADDLGDEMMAMSQGGPSPKDQIAMEKGKIDLEKANVMLEKEKVDLAAKQQELQAQQGNDVEIMYQVAQQAALDVLRRLAIGA